MKADFTRLTFNREKHYNSVRMQQGRVQLDADWNEQADIQAHLGRTQSTDVIGACGAPRENGGFEITATGNDLMISPGRIYVDGILCENEPSDENEGKTLFTGQPYNPGASVPDDAGLYAVYLDVWERHITAVEDQSIREVALNGPDTATRGQTVWQVKLLQVDPLNAQNADLTCWDVPKTFDTKKPWLEVVSPAKGKLAAWARPSETAEKPCIISAAAGYRRLENQLYRVEIHKSGQAGDNGATFKWSRDNGIVLSKVEDIIADQYALVVSNPGKDSVLSFAAGQWVEVIDNNRVLRGEQGFLFKVKSVVENTLVLDISAPETGQPDSPEYTAWTNNVSPLDSILDANMVTVRRWDQSGTDATVEGVEVPSEGTWVDLEDGVQVRFDGSNDENYNYNTGDYWLIPARTVGGDVEWPKDDDNEPRAQPPHGIYHHYCKLALLRVNSSESEAPLEVVHDCRPLFPALNEPDLYYISGDGQEAMPDTPLPQALRVGVSNCNRPIQGAWVMFKVREGTGKIQPKEILEGGVRIFPMVVLDLQGQPISLIQQVDGFIVPTDPQGQAYCIWHMQHLEQETGAFDQLVEATLLRAPEDREEYKLDIPVVFGASLAVAWQDRYGDARFPGVAGQHPELAVDNVEDALDQLRENVSMDYISGDGQAIMRRRGRRTGHSDADLLAMMDDDSIGPESLPEPLKVRVANGDWSFIGATVRFEVVTGAGGLAKTIDSQGPATLDVPTDADGIAQCYWTLDPQNWNQQVSATLIALPGLEPTNPEDPRRQLPSLTETLYFNATLRVAEEVSYDGSDFPDNQHPSLEVLTAERALDQLRENIALYYVGGSGQEIGRMRDEEVRSSLPQPLQVRVANGDWPFKGAKVTFKITDGSNGQLSPNPDSGGGTELADVVTDDQGIAQCYWTPDPDNWSQQVTATLTGLPDVEDEENPWPPITSDSKIVFSANLSVADEVTYDGSYFPDEQHPSLTIVTVEQALDQLRENLTLFYVGGNGQEIVRRRGDGDFPESLPQPLQVRVANGDWPFAGAKVTFKITGGNGQLSSTPDSGGGTSLPDVVTDELGIAQCYWTLDPDTWSQQVTATLTGLPGVGDEENPWPPITSDSRIVFNANLSIAEEVSYDPNEESSEGVATVQAALDDLYAIKVNRAGDTITGPLIIESTLQVDENCTLNKDCVIQGNLTVNGTQVIANTETLEVEDNIIRVNKYAGPPHQVINGGLEVYRGEKTADGVLVPNAQIIWDETSDFWKVGLDGVFSFSVDAEGKVGIGSPAQWAKLEVEWPYADNINPMARFKATGTNSAAAIRFENADNHFNIGITPAGELAIGEYNKNIAQTGDFIRITSLGSVGIGKQSPEERLHVNGNVKADKFIGDGSQLTNIKASQWTDGANGAIYYKDGRVGIGTETPSCLLHVKDATASAMIKIEGVVNKTGEGARLRWTETYATDYGVEALLDGGLDALVFKNIENDAIAADNILVIKRREGNVGIGTPTPGAPLEIKRGAKESIVDLLVLNTDEALMNNGASIVFKGTGTSVSERAKIASTYQGNINGDLRFYTTTDKEKGLTEKMRITPVGRVGIGTVDPQAELHVEGQIYATGAIFYNNTLDNKVTSSPVAIGIGDYSDVPELRSDIYVPSATTLSVTFSFDTLTLSALLFFAGYVSFIASVDGVNVGEIARFSSTGTGNWTSESRSTNIDISAGPHEVKIQWRIGENAFTAQLGANSRMLVQV
jgi:hypothetical protein